MISIIITSFKEPNLKRAIDAVLNNNIKEEYEIIIVAPDKEAETLVKSYKNKDLIYFKDPGKGKSNALNLVFKKAKGDVLILTDGDVFIPNNAINEILELFKDKNIGCVSGHPVALDSRNNLLGYWANFLFDIGAHEISRKKRFKEGKFLECSGYLFAFRNLIKEIPLDVAEDSMIPYLIYKKGFKIGYAENAFVYVKNPNNLNDFIKQRVRTAKAHEKLNYYAPDFPRIKSLSKEFLEGLKNLNLIFFYPKNSKEFIYTLILFPLRLYIWLKVKYEQKFKSQYKDNWERIESTK